jgi:CRISPR/Cas system-associated endonuclease Cas1
VRPVGSSVFLQEVRIGEICQVSLMGNVQLSTQAVQALCEAEVPICYFSMGGWFYGITTGLNQKNVFLRRSQFRLSEQGVLFASRGAAVDCRQTVRVVHRLR